MDIQCPVCLATRELQFKVGIHAYSFYCNKCGVSIQIPTEYSIRQARLLLAYRFPTPCKPYTDYDYN